MNISDPASITTRIGLIKMNQQSGYVLEDIKQAEMRSLQKIHLPALVSEASPVLKVLLMYTENCHFDIKRLDLQKLPVFQ